LLEEIPALASGLPVAGAHERQLQGAAPAWVPFGQAVGIMGQLQIAGPSAALPSFEVPASGVPLVVPPVPPDALTPPLPDIWPPLAGGFPIDALELLPHATMSKLPRERPTKPIEFLRIESSVRRF
jgi:hypothetical protein